MNRVFLLLGSVIIATLSCAAAQSISFHPGSVIAYKESPERSYTTLMLHNIAVTNDTDREITISEIRFEARSAGVVKDVKIIGEADKAAALAQLAGLQEAGVLTLYDFFFQTSKLIGEDTRLSADFSLEPNEAIIVSQTPFVTDQSVDEIVAIVTAKSGRKKLSFENAIAVAPYVSKNEYTFPVDGVWYNGAGAGFRTHHRWVTNEEFALDLGKTGANGLTRKNNSNTPGDFYCYGADVRAIAAGKVVGVESALPENIEMFRQDGEDIAAYNQRIAGMQQAALMENIYSIIGNYVVIEHANGEYSHYVHLAAGSVNVAVGDTVEQGDKIGAVGQTGNSTEPHLHFQITDGPDPLYSRGLPSVFSNIEEAVDGISDMSPASGWIIKTTE